MSESVLLVIRLGAMGDILHALPAAASLRAGYPKARILWAVEPKWRDLLQGNPNIDGILAVDRSNWTALRNTYRELSASRCDVAVDLQGLIKSALAGKAARPGRFYGFDRAQAREPLAAMLYSNTVATSSQHAVERYLDVALAAGGQRRLEFAVPQGTPEGTLPEGDFVLANPFAGWGSKQWPIDHFTKLAELLHHQYRMPLVLNVPPASLDALSPSPAIRIHSSRLPGLIDATRRAKAVVGVDSGPLHLAAALAKPGVAIFGPTDPARNGPYGGTLTVLRNPRAATTYKRDQSIAESMQSITPESVFAELQKAMSD